MEREHPVTPEPIQAGQESVWDYPRPPALVVCTDRVRVILDGHTVADTVRAVRVLETSHPSTFYLPPADVDMTRLDPVVGGSFCEWKGMASYFDIQGARAMRPRVAWTYRDPTPAFNVIANYLAFYPHAMDACYVGEEQVQPQVGDFYGGWITANIPGPFKGGDGTAGW